MRAYAEVIGDPIVQSKSPAIHNFWLGKLGIDAEYRASRVAPAALAGYLERRRADGAWRGSNVTMPHKVAAMAYLDRVDALAAKVGAVNTVIVENGTLVGHNTDVAGFEEPLHAELRTLAPRRGATLYTLIGTGGAARAVAAALSGNEVTVYGRDVRKASELVDSFCLGGGSAHGYSQDIAELTRGKDWSDETASSGIDNGPDQRHSRVIINATALGMAGTDPLAIDLRPYPDDTIVYDLVYAPLETPLLAAARARGLRTIDGLAMLIGQAAAAFELFFGHAAPREHDAELRAVLTRTSP